jgi:hypothetical protein
MSHKFWLERAARLAIQHGVYLITGKVFFAVDSDGSAFIYVAAPVAADNPYDKSLFKGIWLSTVKSPRCPNVVYVGRVLPDEMKQVNWRESLVDISEFVKTLAKEKADER